MLESVQRRAVRQVRGLTGSYEERLAQCGLTLLKDRRLRGDLIQTFKILHQVDDIPINTFFEIAGGNHRHATRHTVTVIPGVESEELVNVSNTNLVKPRAKHDFRQHFFSHRVVDHWNNLPLTVKSAKDVNTFKNLYDAHIKQ